MNVTIAQWEGRGADQLAHDWGVAAVHAFASVGSTNDIARELAARGAPSGTVVVAEEQTAGRGRAGRSWSSAPGLGVWMSVLLRPRALPSPGLLPLAVGLEVAVALEPLARPARVRIKWPNDLLVADSKLGGILCEAAWVGERPAYVVVGVGINVLHTAADFAPELRSIATSLRLSGSVLPDRAAVAGEIAGAVVRAASEPPTELDAAALAARDALRDRAVVVFADDGSSLRGTAAGIAPDGALRIRTAAGMQSVRAGTVRLADTPTSPLQPMLP